MGLAGALAVALSSGSASAQALLPDPPLTTLLKPQALDRSRPLLTQPVPAGGAGRGDPAACAQVAGAGVPPAGAGRQAATGGSGPGEFAPYAPASKPPKPTAVAPTTGSPAGVGNDRPLYGGNDRPLWATGEARAPASQAVGAEPRPSAAATDAPVAGAPTTPSALPRDKPLWADGAQTEAPPPSMTALGRSMAGLPPCMPSSPPLMR